MATAAATFLATPLLAQGRSGGLFGATRSDSTDRNRLNFTFALGEAFDTELPPEFRAGLPQNSRQSGGFSTMLVGSAEYAHNRRRAQIAGTMQTAFRYYQQANLMDAVGHSAGLGVNVRLPGTATFKIDQRAAYSPSYLYQLFPLASTPLLGEAIPVAPDYQVVEAQSYTYHSGMTLGVGSARGARVTVSGAYDRTDFSNRPGSHPDLQTYTGSARLTRGFRRNVGLSAQYEYRAGKFGLVQSSGTTTEHRFAIGADYTRPFSGGRRVNLHGTVTPSLIELPEAASRDELSPSELRTGRLYRMQGEGSVQFVFRRTWSISSRARRSAEYLAVLGEPIFSDSGNLAVQGLFTRRLDLMATAGYALGGSAVDRGSRLDSYTGNVRLRFALKRSMAVYGEYLYYSYDLRRYQHRRPDLPTLFDQHGVRIGLTLWASAF